MEMVSTAKRRTVTERKDIRALADLQKTDSAIDLLLHKREALPERAQLTEAIDLLGKIETIDAQATKIHDAAAREQKRIEDELASVNAKIEKEEKLLFSGNVRNPKELANLEAEVRSLKKKSGDTETELLVAMEATEAAQNKLSQIAEKRESFETRKAHVTERIAAHEADIDEQVAELKENREGIAAALPADLLDNYEKMRAQKAGVAIAHMIEGGICSGCHRGLPASDLDHYHKLHDLYPCPNCKRLILPYGA